VLPEHVVTQDETRLLLPTLTSDERQAARVERMLRRTRIAKRHLGLPVPTLARLAGVADRTEHFERLRLELGERAAREAIAQAGVAPGKIDAVISVSSTEYKVPSVEPYLIDRLGLPPDARRLPLTDLGCAAGVAGVGLAETLAGRVGGTALVVSVELCSLSVKTRMPNDTDAIGNILFGDAAAAAVVSGAGLGLGPEIVATRSTIWPGTTEMLGMRLTDDGFRLTLSAQLPQEVRRHLPASVDRFLADQGLCRDDIAFWAMHPGGPRVLEAIEASLGLSEAAARPTWEAWEEYGNVSSATVFYVLRTITERYAPAAGSLGLMLAFGPGVSCELVLLRAQGWLAQR
jgi:alkylresorcinol/alkylpyrone synthase